MSDFYSMTDAARAALGKAACLELLSVLREASVYCGRGESIPLAVQLHISLKVAHLRDALGISEEEAKAAFGRNHSVTPTADEIEHDYLNGNVLPFERKP